MVMPLVFRGRYVCTVPQCRLPRRCRSSTREWYGAYFNGPQEPKNCAQYHLGAGPERSPSMVRCMGAVL
eukprot:8565582-Pyramimonas_sp.AAC.1